MPYIDRYSEGEIVGIYQNQQHEGQEFVDSAVLRSRPLPLQERIDAECQKNGIANEVTLEGLLGGMLALAMLNGKTIEQLAAENAAFKLGMTLRATFAQWRAEA